MLKKGDVVLYMGDTLHGIGILSHKVFHNMWVIVVPGALSNYQDFEDKLTPVEDLNVFDMLRERGILK